MQEDRQAEVRIPREVTDHGEAGDGRAGHDAVSPDLLGLIGTLEEAQTICGTVGDVHAFPACFLFGIRKCHDALEDTFLERRIVLIHEAVVILDDGAAAECEVIDHLRELLRRSAERLDG